MRAARPEARTSMKTSRLLERAISQLRGFLHSQSANVAIMFGLTAIPLLGLAGAAVDYSRAASDRTKMQAAIDTTALMLAKEAPGLSDPQIQQKAQNYFNALMGTTEVYSLSIASSYNATGGTRIDLTAQGVVDTAFMGLLGIKQVPVATTATATWGNTRLRVALVLDNTGSMAQAGKLTALKTATKNLLTQLKNTAKNPEDVYVSIIPFSKDVNVGSAAYLASWLRWDVFDENTGTCKKSGRTTSDATRTNCNRNGGTWTVADHKTWTGCVTDRDQNFDISSSNPTTSIVGSLFPAEQFSGCPTGVMALSNDWAALNAKVDSMVATGNTNQTIGLQWGYQSIKATLPLPVPSLAPGYEYDNVVILLTDGLNTQNRWTTSQSTIDLRTKKACDTIKADAITIYSVQVNTGGDPTSSMLRDCASSPAKFFILTDANAIVSTFDAIGVELSKLRLSL
jgi:Flp pilus assembly protein TadG